MRIICFIFLLLPRIIEGQTFERLFNEYTFQLPTDVIEMNTGYIVASIYNDNFEGDRAKLLHINKETGELIDSFVEGEIFYGQMNLMKMSDTSFLFVYFAFNEQDSLIVKFKVYNSNFLELTQHSVKINFPAHERITLYSSLVQDDSSHFYYTFGSICFPNDSYNSVFVLRSDFSLSKTFFSHYIRPDFGMASISILPFITSDNALLIFAGRAFNVNNQGQICDSFPDDFMRFNYPNIVLGAGSSSAHWIESNLYLGGTDYRIAKYNLFEKDTIVRYFSHESARAAYYEPMSVNSSTIFLTGIMGYNPSLYFSPVLGNESYLNLFHIDSSLNLIWTRNYNVNDGYYYFPFNTLATSDGGCLIAGTRNNYNLQGRKVDLYLLKVDSLGNYTPMVGLENPSSTLQTLVYPNPGSLTLTIETAGGTAGNTFRMYNSTGMLMLQHRLQTETETMDVSSLPSGLYIYETQNQNGMVERGKWVKMD